MADGSQPNEVLDTIPSFTDGNPAPGSDTSQPAAPAAPATPPADGSGTQPGDPGAPKTALEAAERVMGDRAKEASPASAKPQGDKQPRPGEKAGDATLPFAQHPRWKEVTSENRILRVAKEKNEEAINALTPKGETYDQLTTFLRDSSISGEDFTALLEIGAAVKNDPFKAYEMLLPVMQRLETMVGERLPQDLQNAVTQGQMTEEAAKQIAKARAKAEVSDAQREAVVRRSQETEAQRQAREAEQFADTMAGYAHSHVEMWAKRDPDAALKRPYVEQAVELELRRLDAAGKPPKSQEEMTRLVQAQIDAVNKQFAGIVPARRPTNGDLLPDGGHATQPGNAVPKSSLEAATMALARSRGA